MTITSYHDFHQLWGHTALQDAVWKIRNSSWCLVIRLNFFLYQFKKVVFVACSLEVLWKVPFFGGLSVKTGSEVIYGDFRYLIVLYKTPCHAPSQATLRCATPGGSGNWKPSILFLGVVENTGITNKKTSVGYERFWKKTLKPNSRLEHTFHATNPAPTKANFSRNSSAQLTCWEVKVLLHSSDG